MNKAIFNSKTNKLSQNVFTGELTIAAHESIEAKIDVMLWSYSRWSYKFRLNAIVATDNRKGKVWN